MTQILVTKVCAWPKKKKKVWFGGMWGYGSGQAPLK